MTNSLIYSNTASTQRGGGIMAWAGAKSSALLRIINSTITANTSNDATWGGGGIEVLDDSYPDTTVILEVYNSILYGNTAPLGADLSIDLTGTLSRVDVYNTDLQSVNVASGTYNTGNNLAVAPQFRDSSTHNYRLEGASPLREGGTATVPTPPGLPSTDLDRKSRVFGSKPDMGAYEYRISGLNGILPLILD